ncbi:MAG: hypothetical protein ACM359_14530 [Bacillota bacterium]
MRLTVSVGGNGPLAKATVTPFPRESLSVRATAIQCLDPIGGPALFYTGPRLRTKHLLALDVAMAVRRCRAAVKDCNGMWSEWSAPQDLSFNDFVPGSTNVSIGSGAGDDLALEEPAVRFPAFNVGSSRQDIFRTVVDESFWDEKRQCRWSVKRAAFTCTFSDLDESETLLLHRFYRALNGPLTPFWFDWIDPDTGKEERYIVRFRDPSLADELFTVDRSNMEFTVVELVGRTDPSA